MAASPPVIPAPGTLPGLSAYLELLRVRPELAINPPGGIEILTDPVLIAQAEQESRRGSPAGDRPEWSSVGIAYEDRYIMVVRDAVRFPDGRLGTYQRTLSKPWPVAGVAVLPILDGKILLIRHFRHATRSFSWEAPRGFIDGTESCEQAAERELREEIGARELRFVALGSVHPNNGLSAETVCLLLAEVKVVGEPARAEAIDSIRHLTPAELQALVARDEITDSFTLALVARARARGLL